MVLLIVEGHVPEDRWDDLRRAYARGMKGRPEALLWSYLTQDIFDPTLWRVTTAWESREAARAYAATRDDGTTPSTFPFLLVAVTPDASMGTVHASVPSEQPQTSDGTNAEAD